ncbi:hypothetical protein MHL31_03020 [Lutibacter sp. A80]|uniref:hypothetical protein n=1 Tax=Lutibacter sp. A80 TaxID=2918453 RepID=UPI001F06E14A|nr:hypothetical protein [Lutibacter sp. A80]UMB61184.1 hypothetical protein MHL31_03020 [Lutibacter sp. A80]
MKKLFNGENLLNFFWILFGLLIGMNYYSKQEYLISGVNFMIAILYTWKIIQKFVKK